MPNTDPINDSPYITSYILKKSSEATGARLLPLGAFTRGLKEECLAEIGSMKVEGAVGFSDGGKSIENTYLMRKILDYVHGFNSLAICHCEDSFLGKGILFFENVFFFFFPKKLKIKIWRE